MHPSLPTCPDSVLPQELNGYEIDPVPQIDYDEFMAAVKIPRSVDHPEQSALDLFHPLISGWFKERLGRPTDVQEKAWPRIAAGSTENSYGLSG